VSRFSNSQASFGMRDRTLQSDKYSGEPVLTPLELINRIAQLVPRTCGMDCHGLRPRNDGKPKPRPPSHYLWAALIARLKSYLRGVPADLPNVRGPDAHHRVRHIQY